MSRQLPSLAEQLISRYRLSPGQAPVAVMLDAASMLSPIIARTVLMRLGQSGAGFQPDARVLAFLARRHFSSSGVRMHTGSAAAAAARMLRASAFTIGRDIYFGAGQYRPETARGLGLLAHELTHGRQQAQWPGAGDPYQQGRAMEQAAQRAMQWMIQDAGQSQGLVIEDFVCEYALRDATGLTEAELRRVEGIGQQALASLQAMLHHPIIRRGGHLATVRVDCAIDLATMTDVEAAGIWARAMLAPLTVGAESVDQGPMTVTRLECQIAIQTGRQVEGGLADALAHPSQTFDAPVPEPRLLRSHAPRHPEHAVSAQTLAAVSPRAITDRVYELMKHEVRIARERG